MDTSSKEPSNNDSTPSNDTQIIKALLHEMAKMHHGLAQMQASLSRERTWSFRLKVLRILAVAGVASAAIVSAFMGHWTGKQRKNASQPHAAVIAIRGEIAANRDASAQKVIPVVQEAFKNENAKLIILRVNSPGGSAVQAGLIYDEVQTQKSLHPHKEVISVIEDFGASGGYYVALAGDQIYANRASMVGSIGVITAGFGFSELLNKAGVERRVITAGENKNLLDPFSPLTEDQKEFWEGVLTYTHQQFIETVVESRGPRLVNEHGIFTGLMWTGEQALHLGLIDGLDSAESIMRKLNLEYTVDYTPEPDLLSSFSRRLPNYAVDLFSQFIR